jgi:hypothetical protein
MEIEFSNGKALLNEEQYKVVGADIYENQRILASAGSGKTTTITARISWLVEKCNVKPEQIVLVTFSRNAAREMGERIYALCGNIEIWSGTFHGIAEDILSKFDYSSIKDPYFIDELPIRWSNWMRTSAGRLWVSSIRYVIVDEFQDINQIQWRLLEIMRHPGARFIIVGDDAQNIYTWRGSSANYLLDYHTYVKSVVDYQLRMNYRSTEAIVTVANRTMQKIPTLEWKQEMIANIKGGIKPEVLFFWRASDECKWIAKIINEFRKVNTGKTIAILARNNVDLYNIEEILLQHGILCRYLSHETIDTDKHTNHRPIVDLSTFHGSKGLEWDITFCICLSDERLPGRKGKDQIINERKLFYVGITRARKRLFLTYNGNERHLSRFVREIGYTYLTFHSLAKYALSNIELGTQNPSLHTLLDCIDGEEWSNIRSKGLLPNISAIKEVSYLPIEDTWTPPQWTDTKSFNTFLQLFIRRCMFQNLESGTFQEPFLERIIFTIRIFNEDVSFWLEWQEELTEMIKVFFADSAKLPLVSYSDILEWTQARGIAWDHKQCIAANTILTKVHNQLRPLKYDTYSLEEFTICPTRSVVPTEYRSRVLRSWRKFIDPAIDWKDCIEDIWRLSSLYLVAEGRKAALYKITSILENLSSLTAYLEKTESLVSMIMAGKTECILNPECILEKLNSIQCDALLDSSIVIVTGERKADLYMWIESLLKTYCFISSGTCADSLQLINPYRGTVTTLETIPISILHKLYSYIFQIWQSKNS